MFHVIDDVKDLAEILKEMVSDAGYEVQCFFSGEQYLEYLNSPDYQKPIAVLSDVDMPNFTGHQLALEIRKKHKDQKIVFITGKADGNHYKFSNSQQCGTLQKPYRPHGLISLIHSLAACDHACEYSEQRGNLHECGFGIDIHCPFHLSK